MSVDSNSNDKKISAQHVADIVLDIGTYLLASGAHCGRVNRNLNRFSLTWGFETDISPSFKGLLVTIRDVNDEDNTITLYKSSPAHIVQLSVLTEVSHLSWKVKEENLTVDETQKLFNNIKEKKSYNNIVISIAVGLSCAGLCLFSKGDMNNALITMVAAFIGFHTRAKIAEMRFNPMLSIAMAAFLTTLITGLGSIYEIGENPEAAMATSVLYLIPGVPLINCVIDLIDGYLSSAINRAMFAGFILLCIAAGMTLCITLLGIGNF